MDVYESLRAKMEPVLRGPVRLSRRNHPPAFIMHIPSLVQTHHEAFDVHTDSLMPGTMRELLLEDVRDGRPRWANATCDWEAQLTVLVALHLPPELNAALEYYERVGGEWRGSTIQHKLGHAIILECKRPHRLAPFPVRAAATPETRMTVHAFAIPCEVGERGDAGVGDGVSPREWWLTGVRGGSSRAEDQ